MSRRHARHSEHRRTDYVAAMASETKHVLCRLCGAVIRDDDAIVVVGDAALHTSCAEPTLSTSTSWDHVAVTTLAQLARGAGSASA